MRVKLSVRTCLFLILLGAFAVRLYRLGVASLWYDETVSLFLARQDVVALTRHTAGDIHPPLYYYILHFWGRLAGWSEFSAAFISVFFGVLLIALAYRVAKEWFAGPVPLLAAFLIAISPFNLWYSQEVRMYTLGALLGLASVYLFVRMFAGVTADLTPGPFPKRKGSRSPLSFRRGDGGEVSEAQGRGGSVAWRDLAAYAVVSTLGLYTLYYFAFLLVFENLAAIVWLVRRYVKHGIAGGSTLRDFSGKTRPRNDKLSRRSEDGRSFDSAPHSARGSAQDDSHLSNLQSPIPQGRFAVSLWFLSQLAIVVLYLLWAFVALRQATNPPVPPWRSFTDLLSVLTESFSALALGQSVEPSQVWPLLAIVAALVILALVTTRPSSRSHSPGITGTFLLAYTFIPVLVIFLLSLWKPLYHVRYIFIYSMGFYLLLAVGLARLADFRFGRMLAVASVLLLTVAAGYSDYNFWFNPRYADDDLRGAVQRISSLWRPGDAILIDAGYVYTAFDYYSTLPVAWRGRLIDYAPRKSVTPAGAVVLQAGSIGGAPSLGWGSPESDFYATTAEETRAALDRVFAAHPRVWLLRVYDTVVDPEGVIRDYLAEQGRILDDQGFAGESFPRAQVYLTTRVPLTTLPATAIARRILLGGRIVLEGFEPGRVTMHAGQPLDVNIYWGTEEPTNVDAHLFVGLYSEDGNLVASGEEVPLGNALGSSRWAKGETFREPIRLMVPPAVPPGRYLLRVALYNPLTEEPLTPDPGKGVAENGQVELSEVQIEK